MSWSKPDDETHLALKTAIGLPVPAIKSTVQYSDSPGGKIIGDDVPVSAPKSYSNTPVTSIPPEFATVTPKVTASPALTTEGTAVATGSTTISGLSRT